MTHRIPTSTILLAAALGAQTIDRTKPPETPPLAAYKMPPVAESALANGLRVVMVEDRRFPLVTLRLAFSAGAKFDPAGTSGLAETVAALLREGTPKRTSRQIAEELASLGASLNTTVSPDNLVIGASVLAENAPKLLDLVADLARNASFPEDEITLRKQNREQELIDARSRADTLAEEKFAALVYGAHPYGRILPTAESIARIGRAALVSYRDRMLVPNNAVLILIGALPPRAQAHAGAGGSPRLGAGRHPRRPDRGDAHASGLLPAGGGQQHSGRRRFFADLFEHPRSEGLCL
jgi:zinc protease